MEVINLFEKAEVERVTRLSSAIGRISRSTDYLKDNLNNSDLDHDSFNEKWVKEKNHGSLGDHVVLHFEIRGISILLAKIIERARIGVGYTEASTRYIDFEARTIEDRFYIPEFIKYDEELKKLYLEISSYAFETYSNYKNKLSEITKKEINFDVKDSSRYYLPSNLKVSMGLTTNVRALKSILLHLLTSFHEEALLLFNIFEAQINNDEHLKNLIDFNKIKSLAKSILNDKSFENSISEETKYNILWLLKFHEVCSSDNIKYDVKILKNTLDSIKVYSKNSSTSFRDFSSIEKMGVSTEDFLQKYFHKSDDHIDELLPRILEMDDVFITASIDFGAFRDIQRHRMLTLLYDDYNLSFNINNRIYFQNVLNPNKYVDVKHDKENIIITHLSDSEILDRNMVEISLDQFFQYVLSPLEVENDISIGFDYSDFVKKRLSLCYKFMNLPESEKEKHAMYTNKSDIENYYKVLQILSYTNILSSVKKFNMKVNLRELIKIINLRTKKDSHISYCKFFETIYYILLSDFTRSKYNYNYSFERFREINSNKNKESFNLL